MSGSSVNFLFKRFQPFPDPVEFRRIPEYHDSHIPVVPLQRRKPVLNWHKPEASGTREIVASSRGRIERLLMSHNLR
jgi:hypothetical protein